MMKGLPASGKSTKAKEIVKGGGNFVRLNKDLLREMLHFGKWTGKNEEITLGTEAYIALGLLREDYNIIVDDTNLSKRHLDGWKRVAEEGEVKFEVVDLTDVDLATCVERDRERQKGVGADVIVNMALQYELYKPKKGYVLCDLDGTLCDITHRLKFVKGEGKDWKSFFKGIPQDKLRLDTYEKLCSYKKEGYDIVFLTARPDDYKKETLAWLEKHTTELEPQTLIMRRAGDRRPDVEVKQAILNTYFKDRSLIHKVIDDRPSVIRMWKENELDVIDVGEGKEF